MLSPQTVSRLGRRIPPSGKVMVISPLGGGFGETVAVRGNDAGDLPPSTPRITEFVAKPRVGLTKRRVITGLIVLAVVIYAGFMGRGALIGPGIAILVLVLIAFAFAFVVGRWESDSETAFWRGSVSFDENDFDDKSLFPQITRTPRPSLGRQGLSGGKLEVRADGIAWVAGSVMTPRCEISGSFQLPWERIANVDVGRIPFKANVLGGCMTFCLADGVGELYGEFLGSRKALLRGLRRTPLANRPIGWATD